MSGPSVLMIISGDNEGKKGDAMRIENGMKSLSKYYYKRL